MGILYQIGIVLYLIVAKIISPFNRKAALFSSGRVGLMKQIKNQVVTDKPIIWIHCSSVGEFEQARPLIEKIKEKNTEEKILLTFFSPSGYELRKNYENADWVYYLPIDLAFNAKRFLDIVMPSKAIFIKYEFWYYYLTFLHKRLIPTYLVSAIFRPDQAFFKWYGSFFRRMLHCFDIIFVQNEESKDLLSELDVDDVVVCGDTRFDRVFDVVSRNHQGNEVVALFTNEKKCWVAGSTWQEDEEKILLALSSIPGIKLLLVPHEVEEQRINGIEKAFSGNKIVKYTDCLKKKVDDKELIEADILLVDYMGILSSIYKYGSFAYIGGGFGGGIHNIIEAAAYGAPVIFGPNYYKFREAKDLIALGGAFSFTTSVELSRILSELTTNPEKRYNASTICRKYIKDNLGATEAILSRI